MQVCDIESIEYMLQWGQSCCPVRGKFQVKYRVSSVRGKAISRPGRMPKSHEAGPYRSEARVEVVGEIYAGRDQKLGHRVLVLDKNTGYGPASNKILNKWLTQTVKLLIEVN